MTTDSTYYSVPCMDITIVNLMNEKCLKIVGVCESYRDRSVALHGPIGCVFAKGTEK